MRLRQRAAALAVVACSAGRNDVVPGVLAAAVSRHDVIQREVVTSLAAVLAGVVVALEDLLARELHDRTRSLDVIDEADDRWRVQVEALARNDVTVLLDHVAFCFDSRTTARRTLHTFSG